jgi:hypothetical protein
MRSSAYAAKAPFLLDVVIPVTSRGIISAPGSQPGRIPIRSWLADRTYRGNAA